MQVTNKAVRCDCGHEVQGASEERLLAEVQQHAREAHGIDFSREDALLVVLRAELLAERDRHPTNTKGA